MSPGTCMCSRTIPLEGESPLPDYFRHFSPVTPDVYEQASALIGRTNRALLPTKDGDTIPIFFLNDDKTAELFEFVLIGAHAKDGGPRVAEARNLYYAETLGSAAERDKGPLDDTRQAVLRPRTVVHERTSIVLIEQFQLH